MRDRGKKALTIQLVLMRRRGRKSFEFIFVTVEPVFVNTNYSD